MENIRGAWRGASQRSRSFGWIISFVNVYVEIKLYTVQLKIGRVLYLVNTTIQTVLS